METTIIKIKIIESAEIIDKELIIAKGLIVTINSVHAVATSKNISSYAATKGAILAFTRAISLELAKYNIRVNAVLPGAVDTRMLREGLNSKSDIFFSR